MRAFAVLVAVVVLSGCSSYSTPKPPSGVFVKALQAYPWALQAAHAWDPQAKVHAILGFELTRVTVTTKTNVIQWLGIDADEHVGDGRASTWGFFFHHADGKGDRYLVVVDGHNTTLLARLALADEAQVPVADLPTVFLDSDAADAAALKVGQGAAKDVGPPASMESFLYAAGSPGNVTWTWAVTIRYARDVAYVLVDATDGHATLANVDHVFH